MRPECVEPDIRRALERAQAKVDEVAAQNPTAADFNSTLLALEEATEELDRAWGYVNHLDSVCNSPELRKAYNVMLPEVTDFYTRLTLNRQLWQVLRTYADSHEGRSLNGVRRRFLEETLSDFRDSGADLPAEKKARLEQINSALSAKTQKYSENVLDSTNAWERVVEDEALLDGLPESARQAAWEDARDKGLTGGDKPPKWRFTLQMTSLLPAFKYLHSDSLREEIWQGSQTVGYGGEYDNTALIRDILALRLEKAELLGKKNFPQLVLGRRMARSPERAMAFVDDLHRRVKPAFDAEIRELVQFRAEQTGAEPDLLQPWQATYWTENLRRERYTFDEEALRPYFPLDKVISGMFALVEKLFAVRLKQRSTVYHDPVTSEVREFNVNDGGESVEVWHPEVCFYDIYDIETGCRLGAFYTDWHPRDSKRGGAWMNQLRTGARGPDNLCEPHIGLMCGNMSRPSGGKPALMTHNEVETIFHEFGHLLHHLLGDVEIKSLNGTNVPWDFVELPSQIMENWCWEPEALDQFTGHHADGSPLPKDMLEKMLAARNFMEASATMRQLSFAKMDLELHLHVGEVLEADLDAWLEARLNDYQVPFKTRPRSIVRRFSHLFSSATGYAAGYYSYKWAEVLDADAFTRFQREGILNPLTGKDFRDKILARGNSEPPEILYRDFMGRDPDLSALLRRSGLLA